MCEHLIQAQLGLVAAKVWDREDGSKKPLCSLYPRPSWCQSGSLPNWGAAPGRVPLLAAQGGSLQVSSTGRTSQERNSVRRWKRWREEQSGSYRRKAESYCKLCHKVSCKQWTNIIGFKLLFPIFPSHQLTFESLCLIFHLSHYRILKPSIHSFILLVYCLCKSTRTALQFIAMPFWISKIHHNFFHSWEKKKKTKKTSKQTQISKLFPPQRWLISGFTECF